MRAALVSRSIDGGGCFDVLVSKAAHRIGLIGVRRGFGGVSPRF